MKKETIFSVNNDGSFISCLIETKEDGKTTVDIKGIFGIFDALSEIMKNLSDDNLPSYILALHISMMQLQAKMRENLYALRESEKEKQE